MIFEFLIRKIEPLPDVTITLMSGYARYAAGHLRLHWYVSHQNLISRTFMLTTHLTCPSPSHSCSSCPAWKAMRPQCWKSSHSSCPKKACCWRVPTTINTFFLVVPRPFSNLLFRWKGVSNRLCHPFKPAGAMQRETSLHATTRSRHKTQKQHTFSVHDGADRLPSSAPPAKAERTAV